MRGFFLFDYAQGQNDKQKGSPPFHEKTVKGRGTRAVLSYIGIFEKHKYAF